MATGHDIVIPVKLDEKTFRRFARFDMLVLRKRWLRPAVFALILVAFAMVALFSRLPESGLIAAVLLVVGIGLPLVYIGTFLSQVNMQAARAKLKPARPVYTVTMRDEGVRIVNDQKAEEPQEVSWDSVHKAFRRKGCIYLYVTPAKAFLLPDRQADAPDHEVWNYLVKHLGAARCKEGGLF